MRKIIPFLLAVTGLLLAGCSSLAEIPYSPEQTAETWLEMQPYAELEFAAGSVVLVQPSTTAIVYLLGVITIGAGVYFLRIRGAERSRLWWGIALLLWGAGALFAGSSYEAFSYQLKCVGREVCTWTHWMEIVYLVLSVASVDAMLAAVAYSSASGKGRKRLLAYAAANLAMYLVVVLVGAIMPVKFLISFELLILVCAPTIVIFLVVNGRRYARHRQRIDLLLLGVWGWLILTIAAYFLYYLSDITENLWARGIWFTENDVLHIGLIVWMVYLAVIARQVKDKTQTSA